METPNRLNKEKPFSMKGFTEKVIFEYAGKILVSFYAIILLGLVVYAFFNIKEFADYVISALKDREFTSKNAMVTFIELIDMAMIANLGIMIVKGSYNSFVSKKHKYANENIGSGLLKVKMKTSLINVVGVSLLQKAVLADQTEWTTFFKLGFVYVLFLGGAYALEYADFMHLKSESLYPEHKEREKEKENEENKIH